MIISHTMKLHDHLTHSDIMSQSLFLSYGVLAHCTQFHIDDSPMYTTTIPTGRNRCMNVDTAATFLHFSPQTSVLGLTGLHTYTHGVSKGGRTPEGACSHHTSDMFN